MFFLIRGHECTDYLTLKLLKTVFSCFLQPFTICGHEFTHFFTPKTLLLIFLLPNLFFHVFYNFLPFAVMNLLTFLLPKHFYLFFYSQIKKTCFFWFAVMNLLIFYYQIEKTCFLMLFHVKMLKKHVWE